MELGKVGDQTTKSEVFLSGYLSTLDEGTMEKTSMMPKCRLGVVTLPGLARLAAGKMTRGRSQRRKAGETIIGAFEVRPHNLDPLPTFLQKLFEGLVVILSGSPRISTFANQKMSLKCSRGCSKSCPWVGRRRSYILHLPPLFRTFGMWRGTQGWVCCLSFLGSVVYLFLDIEKIGLVIFIEPPQIAEKLFNILPHAEIHGSLLIKNFMFSILSLRTFKKFRSKSKFPLKSMP